MKAADAPRWGTIQQAAERKSVSVRTIRRYISQGLVRAERIGPRLIRVDLESVDRLGRSLQPQYGGGRRA